ncbi:MAG: RadC family protein [Thermaurantimonas sp.]
MSDKNIKSWADDDRPREKLTQKGREALSDAELLAILLGSGTRELNAVELARKLLRDVCRNDLVRLSKLSLKELKSIKGIGQAKAITIMAALELGRRARETRGLNTVLNSAQKAYEYLIPYLADLDVEKFYVIYLSNKLAVLGCEQIGSGGITATVVDPIVVFKKALEHSATNIIISHNHPSGNLRPSEADRNLTKRIDEGCKILGIKLNDHLIIGTNEYYSFVENGEL